MPTLPTPSLSTPALDALQHELRETLNEARALQEQIANLYRILAINADPECEAERELRELITNRRALAARIGHHVMRLLAQGARFDVQTEGQSGPAPSHSMDFTHDVAPSPSPIPNANANPNPIGDEVSQAHAAIVPRAMPTSAELSHTVSPAVRSHVKPTKIARAEPADPASLIALAQLGLTPQWSQRRSHTARRKSLTDLVESVGAPRSLKTRGDVADAVQRLTGSIARMDAWLDQSQEAQKALMGLISSLARQIQDESAFGLNFAEDEALRSAFSRMTAWSREHRPGFVPGLSRSNPPDHGSWYHDYFHWYQLLQPSDPSPVPATDASLAALQRLIDRLTTGEVIADEGLYEAIQAAIDAGVTQSDPRLVAMLRPHADRLAGAPSFKTLKTAVRQATTPSVSDEEVDEHNEVEESIPDNWPLYELTEGKHAVVIGGDPRPQAMTRIHGALKLRNLEWEQADVRRVRALADRIRGGSIDLVIVLRRFISHREHELVRPACAEANVPICVVDTGYGVTQIKLAMERYWSSLVSTERVNEPS